MSDRGIAVLGGTLGVAVILGSIAASFSHSSNKAHRSGSQAQHLRSHTQPTKSTTDPVGVRLTANEIPDVLSPGVWPGADLRAYRYGDGITILTDWGDDGITVDGRSTTDAANSICLATIGDLGYDMNLAVKVLAANGWEHLAFKQSGGKCHTG